MHIIVAATVVAVVVAHQHTNTHWERIVKIDFCDNFTCEMKRRAAVLLFE